jgi:hypothetical protein
MPVDGENSSGEGSTLTSKPTLKEANKHIGGCREELFQVILAGMGVKTPFLSYRALKNV